MYRLLACASLLALALGLAGCYHHHDRPAPPPPRHEQPVHNRPAPPHHGPAHWS